MELELGLALPNQTPMLIQALDLNRANIVLEMDHSKQKRRFVDDHDGIEEVESKLSLLLWTGAASGRPKSRKLHVDNRSIENEENQEMPAVDSWRNELPHHRNGGFTAAEQTRNSNSTYVKVKMEGVGIGRKIDLWRYHSYLDLINALIDMFAKYYKIGRKEEDYILLYQDKEGDWMLVGDVQWETFVESVQRLEILKNHNKMGSRLWSGRI